MKWYKEFDYKNFYIWIGPIPFIMLVESKFVEVSL